MAVFLLLVPAADSSAATEDSVVPENLLLSDRPAESAHRFKLGSLLSWPEKEQNAEEEEEIPLESDRPDFTEASTTVGYRRLQIESGYTYNHNRSNNVIEDIHDLPELLVRYGVAERLELRFAWQGIVLDHLTDRSSGQAVNVNGSSDLEFGVKYALSKQEAWRPRSAVIVAVTAPAGTPAYSSRQVDTEINYLYSWELSKHLSLNCSTGDTWTSITGDHQSRLFQSASVEYELTERLHAYSEWYALFPRDAVDNRPQHNYDGGFTYLVTPNFQLDWRAGLGLNDAAGGFFTGCGLTIRR